MVTRSRRQFGYRDLSDLVLSIPMLRIHIANVGGELKVSVLRRSKPLAGPHGGENLDFAADLCVQQLAEAEL